MPWPVDHDSPISIFLELVTEDVVGALAGIFEPPEPDRPASGIVFPDEIVSQLPYSGDFAAVPWTWVGTHVGRLGPLPPDASRGDFPVRVPTEQVVAVEGLSLLQRVDPDEVSMHRYVDWLSVYQQLGLLMAGRTPFAGFAVDS